MTKTAAIPETWKEWLLHNRDRGCARDGLVERAMAQGFDRDAIEAVLDEGTAVDLSLIHI